MGVVKSKSKCTTVGIQGIAWAFGRTILPSSKTHQPALPIKSVRPIVAVHASEPAKNPVVSDKPPKQQAVQTAPSSSSLATNHNVPAKWSLETWKSKRTLVPALNMRLRYAPQLELPDGVGLKGATLVAIRPSERSLTAKKEVSSDLSWISTAFEEPYGTAAKMLVKRRTSCLEMNSF
ncbi:hypothetical protein FF1_038332 [Malus domestica]